MMKRYFYLAFAALALFACTKPDPKPGPEKPDGPDTPGETTDGYESISVILKASNLKTAWAEGDEIQVYCVTNAGADVEAKYVLSAGAGSATGTFKPAAGVTALEKGGKDYFAAYPYDEDRTFAQHNTFTAVIPSDQTAAMPLFAHATDAATLELKSFMGAIKFTLTGDAEIVSIGLEDNNSNSILSGNVTFNAKTGKVSIKNSSASKHEINYVLASKLTLDGTSDPIIIEVPEGTLAAGGKLTVFDPNGNAAAVIEVPAQTIAAGTVNDLGNFAFEAVSQTVDLSVSGTANSYIVNAAGAYKFKAVKGNSSDAVAAAGLEVLWETRCDDAEVAAGTVIKSVNLADGYVEFETAKPLVPGNALIAAKDAEDNVLWSWHIWIPETAIVDISEDEASFWATAVMDRNLGALVAADTLGIVPKSYGLSYQWGRVTPLIRPEFLVSGTALAGTEGAQPLDYWIAHPTEISSGVDNNWLNENKTDLWDNNGEKTIYDPCPVGYRVPPYNNEYKLWIKRADEDWAFNQEQLWFYFKDTKITFPLCGYIDGGGAYTNKHGIRALIWSATPGLGDEEPVRGSAAFFDLSRDSGKYYYHSYFKYAGGSIRCAKEH